MCEGAKLHQVWSNTCVALWFCYGLRKPPSSVADITAAALATGACIVGILCLPLILLLIYKQRQAVSSRRTYSAHLLGHVTMVCVGWDVSCRGQGIWLPRVPQTPCQVAQRQVPLPALKQPLTCLWQRDCSKPHLPPLPQAVLRCR